MAKPPKKKRYPSWHRYHNEGSFPGRVVKSPARPAASRNPGQAPVAAEQQAGRDARMPAFTGLTGDLCYAVPPLATGPSEPTRLVSQGGYGHERASRRAGAARQTGGGRAVGGKAAVVIVIVIGKSAPFRWVGD